MQTLLPYFSFKGRASRLKYWRVQLVVMVLAALPIIAALLLVPLIGPFVGIFFLVAIPLIAVSLAVVIQRLHDRNKSALWLLPYWVAPAILSGWVEAKGEAATGPFVLMASLASVAITIWSVVDIGFVRGTTGPNRFGEDPLSPAPVEVFA